MPLPPPTPKAAPGLLLAAAVALLPWSGAPGQESGGFCAGEAEPLGPDRSLYCVRLVPSPEVREASGAAELGWRPGPFTVSVTPAGRLAPDVTVRVRDLPPPDSLGPYDAYVAWAAAPGLEPVVKLGPVTDGRAGPARVALDRFLVLVTAEPSADVERRSGPPVLRGMSPAMQMSDVHLTGLEADPDDAARGETDRAAASGGPRWTRPPANPRVTPLGPPGLRSGEPAAAPVLPRWRVDPDTLPGARHRRVRALDDGDTIRLEAGLVRRSVGGRSFVMLGYNRQIPGPLLRVPHEAAIHARLVNRTGWPTTVHWHGVRIENRFDGVPGVTQAPVAPRDSFLYRVRFPDAGLYWYHPHVREDLQQDLGLYGNVLVEPGTDDHYGPAHRDEVLMLDDLLVGEAGLVPWGRERATHAVMGRFGNVLLVNGEPSWSTEARRGEVVRFHLTNVSNVRTFNLSFGGAPMKVVASDVSRFQREAWTESVVIAPAERYVVDVRFPEAGPVPVVNRVQAIDHGSDDFFTATDTLGVVRVSDEPARPDLSDAFEELRRHEGLDRRIRETLRRGEDAPRRRLELTVEDTGLPFALRQLLLQEARSYVHPLEWTGTMPVVGWLPTDDRVRWILREPSTGRENREISWSFETGDLVRLRVHNDRRSLHPMQHPIHIHGQRFLVTAVNGVPADNLAWKDTVLVPVGATVDLLLELSNPGEWMVHCHVSEHLEAGMKFTFTVEEGPGGAGLSPLSPDPNPHTEEDAP